MISAIFLIVIVSTALLFGNEFSVGVFIHPSLARDDHRALLPAIQVFARFFGNVLNAIRIVLIGMAFVALLLAFRTLPLRE
jgi:hypothetical protein